MKSYLNSHWQLILTEHGLTDFNTIWEVAKDWVEDPNLRRGGMSGVACLELTQEDGEKKTLFVKKQSNHRCKNLSAPFFGIPTLEREMETILAFQQHHIPTLEPVLFLKQGKGANQQAILITSELKNYLSLEAFANQLKEGRHIAFSTRCKLIEHIAKAIAKIHLAGFVHRCLYPKHIFIRPDDWDIRFIDLEKAKESFSFKRAMLRDLSSLERHATYWSMADRLRFLKDYLTVLGQDKLKIKVLHQLGKRHRKKIK